LENTHQENKRVKLKTYPTVKPVPDGNSAAGYRGGGVDSSTL